MFVLNSALHAAEPDESGVGGTGHAEPETLLELFHKPDLPERVNIPDSVVVPHVPELDTSVSAGGGSADSVPSGGDMGTAAGATDTNSPP